MLRSIGATVTLIRQVRIAFVYPGSTTRNAIVHGDNDLALSLDLDARTGEPIRARATAAYQALCLKHLASKPRVTLRRIPALYRTCSLKILPEDLGSDRNSMMIDTDDFGSYYPRVEVAQMRPVLE